MNEQTFVDFMNGTDDNDLTTIEQIDELIKQHRKSITDNRKEIKRCQQRIENLEFKKNKLVYGNDTIIFEVADSIHDMVCKEGSCCNWASTTWDDFWKQGKPTNTERGDLFYRTQKMLEKAKELNIGFRKMVKLIEEFK